MIDEEGRSKPCTVTRRHEELGEVEQHQSKYVHINISMHINIFEKCVFVEDRTRINEYVKDKS